MIRTINVGTMQMIDDLDGMPSVSGDEGTITPLLFGRAMSCHKIDMPAGYYPPHPHDFELTILCIRGELDLIQGEHRRTMKPFSIMCVPEKDSHGWEVKEGNEATIVVFVAPRQWSRDEFVTMVSKSFGGEQ